MIKKINTIKVDSLEELIYILENNVNPNDYYYRGMASSQWNILTSVERKLDDIRKVNSNVLLNEKHSDVFLEFKAQLLFIKKNEKALIDFFKIKSNEFILDNNNFLILQIILQHFGYPTRLSDWSKQWKYALYFCLEDASQNSDFVIWRLKKNKIPTVSMALKNPEYLYEDLSCSNDNIINSYYRRLKEGIYLVDTDYVFKRIEAQDGVILCSSGCDYMNFQQHIMQSNWISEDDIDKIIVDKSARNSVKQYLNSENINSKTLYPKDFLDSKFTNDIAEIEEFINKLYIQNFKIE